MLQFFSQFLTFILLVFSLDLIEHPMTLRHELIAFHGLNYLFMLKEVRQ